MKDLNLNNNLLITTVISFLVSSYLFGFDIVTRDDFYPGNIDSFLRDGRITTAIIYYPLYDIFNVDMHFSTLMFIFLNISSVMFFYISVQKLSTFGKQTNTFIVIFLLIMFYSFNSKLLIYKAAFLFASLTFIISTIVVLWSKNIVFCSFLTALVFNIYQPYIFLPLGLVALITLKQKESIRTQLSFITKYIALCLLFIISIHFITSSGLYTDYFNTPPKRSFNFVSLDLYFEKLKTSLNAPFNYNLVLIWFYITFLFSFNLRDKSPLILLFLLFSLTLILNPIFVLNSAFNSRANLVIIYVSLLLSIYVFMMKGINLERYKIPSVLGLITFLLLSYTENNEFNLNIFYIVVSFYFLSSLILKRLSYLNLLISILTITTLVSYNYSYNYVQGIKRHNALDKHIWSVIQKDITEKKIKSTDRIDVYIGRERESKYYSSISSYPSLSYFKSNNIFRNVKYHDAGDYCKGKNEPENNALIYCF